MTKLISEETEAAIVASGIRVTRSRQGGVGKPGGKTATPIAKKFAVPTPPKVVAAQKAADEDAFGALLAEMTSAVEGWTDEIGEGIRAGGISAAQEFISWVIRVCDADGEAFPSAKNFVGNQIERFCAAVRPVFLGQLLKQELPDGAYESVVKLTLELAAGEDGRSGWRILQKVGEKPEIGVSVQVNGIWYIPTAGYEEVVVDHLILVGLYEKSRAAIGVQKDARRKGAAELREIATVESVSDFLALTPEGLTEQVSLRNYKGEFCEVPVATCFLWIPRRKWTPRESPPTRYITHEGGVLLVACKDTRTSRDRDSGESKSWTGLVVGVMPPTHEGDFVVDGAPKEFENDAEGVERVEYSTLSEALKRLAAPVSDRGHWMGPRVVPLVCLVDKEARRLNLPYFVHGDEFKDTLELYRHVSWGVLRALQQEAAQAGDEADREKWKASATVEFADFFPKEAKDAPAGTAYLYLAVPWKAKDGRFHRHVHFLAARVAQGGPVSVAECPEGHKALLGDADELGRIVKRLERTARNAAAKVTEAEVATTDDKADADTVDLATTELVTENVVADAEVATEATTTA